MTDPVKLAGGLPKHEAVNGLRSAGILADALHDPDHYRVTAVVVLDVAKTERITDTGETVPTFRVIRIEPAIDDTQRTQLGVAIQRAHEQRMGVRELPLDLDGTLGADIR